MSKIYDPPKPEAGDLWIFSESLDDAADHDFNLILEAGVKDTRRPDRIAKERVLCHVLDPAGVFTEIPIIRDDLLSSDFPPTIVMRDGEIIFRYQTEVEHLNLKR